MKLRLISIGWVLILSACSGGDKTPAESVNSAPAAKITTPAAVAVRSNKISGLNVANMNKKIRPQDDLYRAVNGHWLSTFKLPADKSNFGTFSQLYEQSQKDLRTIIEVAARTKNTEPKSDTQRVGDYYNTYMDLASINRKGITPLRESLAEINTIKDKTSLLGEFVLLGKLGVHGPLRFYVTQDDRNSSRYISYLGQSGLSMPDRDYYLKDDAKSKQRQQKFRDYIARLLTLAGIKQGKTRALAIYTLEKSLAEKSWTRVQNRDPQARYNPFPINHLDKLSDKINWKEIVSKLGIGTQKTIIVTQPSFVRGLGNIVQSTPLDTWKAYLSFKLINTFAADLSKDFVDAKFGFYGKTLRGVPQNQPRWKRAVNAIDEKLGEIVGKIYVAHHFKPEAKARVAQLVENLRQAFALEIKQLDWMSEATKQKALHKLDTFRPKIGYPNKWKNYAGLEIRKDDLVGNDMRVAQFEFARMIKRLGQPVDREEWLMTPQTVNAYYNPPMNEIVFPAAILQPPFFNMAADDAVNYGGIGAVIGHEMSHGFDDQGRQYDADGNLKDWWTAADAKRFKVKADRLAAFYSKFKTPAGEAVNGKLTLGENIADLGGITIAYKAYQMSLKGKPAPVINGLSGAQRFFMGWSQVWARKYRAEELHRRILTDPHSPSEFRANGPVQHVAAFYQAFKLQPGDKLYRKPKDRIKIW